MKLPQPLGDHSLCWHHRRARCKFTVGVCFCPANRFANFMQPKSRPKFRCAGRFVGQRFKVEGMILIFSANWSPESSQPPSQNRLKKRASRLKGPFLGTGQAVKSRLRVSLRAGLGRGDENGYWLVTHRSAPNDARQKRFIPWFMASGSFAAA